MTITARTASYANGTRTGFVHSNGEIHPHADVRITTSGGTVYYRTAAETILVKLNLMTGKWVVETQEAQRVRPSQRPNLFSGDTAEEARDFADKHLGLV